jgi:hypothetical protein
MGTTVIPRAYVELTLPSEAFLLRAESWQSASYAFAWSVPTHSIAAAAPNWADFPDTARFGGQIVAADPVGICAILSAFCPVCCQTHCMGRVEPPVIRPAARKLAHHRSLCWSLSALVTLCSISFDAVVG